MEAFRNYDFESDEAWKLYELNLTIPPGKEHLLLRKKAQWYAKNVDEDFDPSSIVEEPKTTSTEAPPKAAEPTQSRPNSTARPAASASPPAPHQTLQDIILFIGNVLLVLSVIVSIQPFDRYLAFRAYFVACRISAVVHFSRVVSKHGLPKVSPFSYLGQYMQRVSSTTDFFYGITSLMASSNPHMWLITLPMAILSVYHVSVFINKTARNSQIWQRFGLKYHTWLSSHKEDALRLMALIEVLTVLHAAVGIMRVGIRGVFVGWMYLTRLRVRFWSPESRAYHLFAWNLINSKAEPLLVAVPALRRVVGAGKAWFDQPRAQQQQHQQ